MNQQQQQFQHEESDMATERPKIYTRPMRAYFTPEEYARVEAYAAERRWSLSQALSNLAMASLSETETAHEIVDASHGSMDDFARSA